MKEKKIRGFFGIVLMLSMMSVMSTLNPIKMMLLFILCLLWFQETRVCKQNKKLCAYLCISTLLGNIVGFLSGTDYPFYNVTVGIIWPILSLIIVTPLLKTSNDYKMMIKWMFYMHIFLIVYDLLFAFSVVRGNPIINLYPEVETGFSFYETTSRMNFVNLNVLTFTTPLFFLLYLTQYDFGVKSRYQLVILLLNLFLLIFSGRRSLMLIFILCPIFTLLFSVFFPKESVKRTKKYLFLILVIVLGALGYIYTTMPDVFDGYLYTFTKAFDSSVEDTKFVQARMLWSHFEDHPFLGSGTGATFYESARGIRQHQFELTYLAKLANGGFLGFVLYILGTVGVFFVGLKYAKKRNDTLFICMLLAYLFVLIADATNPVLCSFDLMLPLFLCYAKINSCVFNYDNVRVA